MIIRIILTMIQIIVTMIIQEELIIIIQIQILLHLHLVLKEP